MNLVDKDAPCGLLSSSYTHKCRWQIAPGTICDGKR